MAGSVVTWSWQELSTIPPTNSPMVVTNPTVAADQYIIYAGARSLSGSDGGHWRPGWFRLE